MSSPEPRYYVRHDGQSGDRRLHRPPFSYIRDRWYGCRDVARFRREGHDETLAQMRRRAEAVCAEWNAEHDAFLREAG